MPGKHCWQIPFLLLGRQPNNVGRAHFCYENDPYLDIYVRATARVSFTFCLFCSHRIGFQKLCTHYFSSFMNINRLVLLKLSLVCFEVFELSTLMGVHENTLSFQKTFYSPEPVKSLLYLWIWWLGHFWLLSIWPSWSKRNWQLNINWRVFMS